MDVLGSKQIYSRVKRKNTLTASTEIKRVSSSKNMLIKYTGNSKHEHLHKRRGLGRLMFWGLPISLIFPAVRISVT